MQEVYVRLTFEHSVPVL
jgi:hypothetical protein